MFEIEIEYLDSYKKRHEYLFEAEAYEAYKEFYQEEFERGEPCKITMYDDGEEIRACGFDWPEDLF